jgi:hypothetical protein
MHRALLLLCAVRRRPAAKAQLQCTSALKSLLLLLRCGSPRLQRSVLLLLSSALPGAEPAAVEAALPAAWRTASIATDNSDSSSGASAATRKQQRAEGLIGVLLSAVQLAYSVADLPSASHATAANSAATAGDSTAAADTAVPLLRVGCGRGYGAGRLDLCFADQCAALLRTLLRATLWRERVARALLVRIHAARNAVRQSSTASNSTTKATAAEALAAGAAAVAVLAGSSGALYPGAPIKSRRAGARGTLVHCEPGAAKAAAVFAGAESGGCETVRVRDLEVYAADTVNPDTASQPVTAQLATLTQALLESASSSSSSSSSTDSSVEQQQHMQAAEARLLSLALSALLQQVAARPQAVAAVCADTGDAPALLPALLRAAVQASPLPCLASVSEVRKRWRAGVSRVLSAHRIGAPYTCLSAVQQRAPPVPLPETPPAQQSSKVSAATAATATAAAAASVSDSTVHSDSTAGDSAAETASCQWQRAATHGTAVVAPSAPAAAAAVNTGSSDNDMCVVVEFNDGVADGSTGSAVAAAPSADDECASVCDGEEVSCCCATIMSSLFIHSQTVRLFADASMHEHLTSSDSPSTILQYQLTLHALVKATHTDTYCMLHVVLLPKQEGNDSNVDGDSAPPSTRGSSPTHFARSSHSAAAHSQDSQSAALRRSTAPEGALTHVLETDSSAQRAAVAEALAQELAVLPDAAHAAVAAFGTSSSGVQRARHWLSMQARRGLWVQTNSSSSTTNNSSSKCATVHSVYGGELRTKASAATHPVPARYTDEDVVAELLGTGSAAKPTTATAAAAAAETDSTASTAPATPATAVSTSSTPATVTSRASPAAASVAAATPAAATATAASTAAAAASAGDRAVAIATAAVAEANLLSSANSSTSSSSSNVRDGGAMPLALREHDLQPLLLLPRPMPVRPLAVRSAAAPAAATTVVTPLSDKLDWLVPGQLVAICDSSSSGSSSSGSRASTVFGTIAEHFRSGSEQGAHAREDCAVLVTVLDDETGLCSGRRVPPSTLQASSTFFGQSLGPTVDTAVVATLGVLKQTDEALAVLQARALLVRLAQVTAAAASGSAQGSVGGAGTAEDLLQLMRLLAAQDMAGGRDRLVCNVCFCNAC